MFNKREKKEGTKEFRYLQKRTIHSLGIILFCGAFIWMGNHVKAESLEAVKEIQTGVAAPEENAKGGQPDEKKGRIVTRKGEKYYLDSNDTKAKKKFVTVGKKTYYFDSNGRMKKGWMKKGKDYYYFDRTSGVQKKNCKVDGVKLAKNGKAEKTAYTKKKIETMITAKAIVNKKTKITDSKEKKLEIMFKWVMGGQYKRYRIFPEARKKKGWEMTYANDVFKKKRTGCCVSDACAFAFLARECGYTKVYVCDDTGHAWVEINGRVYDTLFAETKGYHKYYNATYKEAKLYCVNKLKI